VTHISQAYECGAIQNPANLRAQVVGAIIQGLGGALWEHVAFKNGRVTNPRFSDYRVPRMEDLPEIDVVLVDRRDLASIGAGETPIIAVAPAIANALFQATGERRRTMPLVRES
jgi:isoquinoline 1-oxidoreductase